MTKITQIVYVMYLKSAAVAVLRVWDTRLSFFKMYKIKTVFSLQAQMYFKVCWWFDQEKNKYQVSDYFFEISYCTYYKNCSESCTKFLYQLSSSNESLFSSLHSRSAFKNNFQDYNHKRLSKQLFESQLAIGKLEQAPRRGLPAEFSISFLSVCLNKQ